MRQSLETSGTDRLTSKELNFLEPDEWVEIKKVRDFVRDQRAETKSYLRVSEADLVDNDPEEEPDEDADTSEVGSFRLDKGKYTMLQFEYMCTGWNLYHPADADGNREPIEFTRENREKFIRTFGVYFFLVFLNRGGGIEPVEKLKGQVDANGEPLSFQNDPELPVTQEIPVESAKRSIRTLTKVHDRQDAGVQVG